MRFGLSLGTIAACAGAGWLAIHLAAPRRSADAGVFTLQVPATHLSVDQQIRPRLLRPADAFGDGPRVTLVLENARGQALSTQHAQLTGHGVEFDPIHLPAPGSYRLRASAGQQSQNIALHARTAPRATFGGVVAVGGLGLAEGAANYLRAHGFAVSRVTAAGDFPAAGLYLVGDPRLDLPPSTLAAAYTQLWRRVGNGAQVLLLAPPPPGVAAFWPLQAPLVAAGSGCGGDLLDPALTGGLDASDGLSALLMPGTRYDLSADRDLDLYRWNGFRLPRTSPSAGYGGCHALFSYRYGSGWVTESMAPLLAHFQDIRARVYLMNLIRAVMRRKHPAPASPGLEWVMQQRLKKLSRDPGSDLQTAAAAFYDAPPRPVAPAPVLVPALTDGDASRCWTPPRPRPRSDSSEPGQWGDVRLSFGRPLAVGQLAISFGSDRAYWPSGVQVSGTRDGVHWEPLPHGTLPVSGTAASGIDAQGVWTLSIAASHPGWRGFRLIPSAPAGQAWRMCEITAR